jgi:hypothetical protein
MDLGSIRRETLDSTRPRVYRDHIMCFHCDLALPIID